MRRSTTLESNKSHRSFLGTPVQKSVVSCWRQRKTRFRGTRKVIWVFTLAADAYNVVCLPKRLGAVV